MVETRGSRRFAILFLATAFALLLFGRFLKPVNAVATVVLAPFAAVINGAANGVGDTLSGVVQGPHLRAENQQLKQQIATLISRNQTMQEAMHENAYLLALFHFDRLNPALDFLTARVIDNDPNTLGQYVVIDRGSRNGVHLGMSVVSQDSYFAGTVVAVVPNAARVQLMTNPSSTVGAYDEQTRAQGIVFGQYGDLPQLRIVPTSARLRVGDFIRTSGQANLFPRGILLGQVVSVHRQNVQQLQSAVIKPATDFGSMEVVQVVRNFRPSVPVKLLQGP
jgi:rod shape-determining protein MreC